MNAVETLKGYVNTWQCDENDHLNVQFYIQFFEDAGAHFQALADVSVADRRRPRSRHVRYHGELAANDAVVVESHGISETQAVHLLHEMSSRRLSATCIETFDDPPASLRRALVRHANTLPEAAAPRSITSASGSSGFEGTVAQPDEVVLRARLRAQHCDTDGTAFDSAFVGFNSDSAANFWNRIGVDGPWLTERNLGRVAVEMRLIRTGLGRFGDLVHVVNRPIAAARSTVTFENHFVLTETGELAAIIQVTGLTMNLTSRRAEPLPEDLRVRVATMIDA